MAYEHCGIEIGKILDRTLTQDEIESLQEEILKEARGDLNKISSAAKAVGEEKILAKKIQKRNAALNLRRRLEMTDYIMREYSDDPALGMQALLVGTNRVRMGSRFSAAAVQNQKAQYYQQKFIADIEKTGYWKEFIGGHYDTEISEAIYRLGNDHDISEFSDVARKVAPVVERWNEISRQEANRAGAWIAKEPGYIQRQNHDMQKVRNAHNRINGTKSFDENENYQAWKEKVLPLLDTERTFKKLDAAKTEEEFLRSVWKALSSGVHLLHDAGDGAIEVPAGNMSIARRMSHDRILHFKDGKSWSEYNKLFGSGSLRESIMFGLDRQARNTALMEALGPNPRSTMDKVYENLRERARDLGLKQSDKLKNKRSAFENWMAELDGSINIPANFMGARASANIRAVQSMAKLGSVVVSAIADIPNIASEAQYQGIGFLSGYSQAFKGILQGRSTAEQRQILAALGVQMRGMSGDMIHRYSAQDDLGGIMSSLMRTFYKYNGLTPWTDMLRRTTSLMFSRNLANHVGQGFSGLDSNLKRIFGLFGIDDGMWDMIRRVELDRADDDIFLTPEMARKIPESDIVAYLQSKNLEPTKSRVRSLREEIENKFRSYFVDRTEYAVIEPDARVRAVSKLGTKPGTWEGELVRFIMQFKSFPAAVMLKPLSRNIWGRGVEEDNFVKAMMAGMKNGNGEMMAMAHHIAMTGIFGYLAMSAKDVLKGREPRDPTAQSTLMAALAQGGGLGIYTDFLFGDMRNRFGGTALSTLAGPTAGAFNDVVDIFQRLRDGDDAASSALNTVLSNTPFVNLFYTRMVLDYLLIYRIKEAMNPGYLRRMEKRIEKQNAQEFIVKPSEAVR